MLNRTRPDQGVEDVNNRQETVPDIDGAACADNRTRRSTRNRTQPPQLVDYQVGAKKRKLGRDITFNLLGEETGVGYAAKFSDLRGRLTKNRYNLPPPHTSI